ncbi:MAG: type II toxin-antitoxin system RelE/ParE family toxin [Microcystaceae cyanobacterium]
MSKAKKPYIIQSVRDLQNDLSQLPLNLQQKWQNYQKILALDPYQTLGFPSHNLTGKLKGCRALEIDWNGSPYRLVYRIHEKPSPKRVVILSFAEHDPAYEKAKKRK